MAILHKKINCGLLTDLQGWQADTGFGGGAVFTFGIYPDIDVSKISNPAPLKIYDTARYLASYLQYTITGLDSAKSYRVILHWCETNASRMFRAFVNTVEISSGGTGGMSVYAAAGANTAYTLSRVISATTSANIEIYETAVNAFICAIEVIEIETPSLDIPFNVLGLLPEKYFENVPDFDKVTEDAKFQDGGKIFNINNSTAPREWTFEFSGLSEKQAAVFDEHYRFADGELGAKKDFGFTDRKNYIYDARIYYKDYDKSHEKHRRWIQNRRITLIKYP